MVVTSTPKSTPTPNVITRIKSTLIDRFKKGLGKAGKIARGTFKNMAGAADRWEGIQAAKNENYLSNLKKEKSYINK